MTPCEVRPLLLIGCLINFVKPSLTINFYLTPKYYHTRETLSSGISNYFLLALFVQSSPVSGIGIDLPPSLISYDGNTRLYDA